MTKIKRGEAQYEKQDIKCNINRLYNSTYMVVISTKYFQGEQTWYSNVFSYQHFVDSNLIPFRTIIMYIYCLKNGNINIDIPIKNVLANFSCLCQLQF